MLGFEGSTGRGGAVSFCTGFETLEASDSGFSVDGAFSTFGVCTEVEGFLGKGGFGGRSVNGDVVLK